MKQQDLMRGEQEKIDNYLITTSIVLLGGFTILLSVNKNPFYYSSILNVIAVSCFTLTIGFSLWQKYRKALRRTIFEGEQEKLIADSVKDIKALMELAGQFAGLEGKNYAISHQDELGQNKEVFGEKMKAELKGMPGKEHIIQVFAENISNKIQLLHNKSFGGRLEEKAATPKYIIEYIAVNYRYYIFSLGLLSFVGSLLLNATVR